MPDTIVILGGAEDEHVAAMHEHLRGRGADVELVDSRSFPTELSLSLTPSPGEGAIGLPAGRVLPVAQIKSLYWRNYFGVAPPPLEDPDQAYIAYNDARSLFEAFLMALPARMVNGWTAYHAHQTKPQPLAAIAAQGVRVPATLWTNDAVRLREFAARHARAIFKPWKRLKDTACQSGNSCPILMSTPPWILLSFMTMAAKRCASNLHLKPRAW